MKYSDALGLKKNIEKNYLKNTERIGNINKEVINRLVHFDKIKNNFKEERINLFIDLDNVLADFNDGIGNHARAKEKTYKGQPHLLPNIYLELNQFTKQMEAIQILNQSEKVDCFVLSTSPWDHPEAWMHKRIKLKNILKYVL